jgi:replicative DNA helicase
MTSVFERGLPVNADAERFVLGSILLSDARYPDVSCVLDVADFAIEKHRRIAARMKDLY